MIINPRAVGFETRAFIGLNVKPGISRKVVARKLSTLKNDRILEVVSLSHYKMSSYLG